MNSENEKPQRRTLRSQKDSTVQSPQTQQKENGKKPTDENKTPQLNCDSTGQSSQIKQKENGKKIADENNNPKLICHECKLDFPIAEVKMDITTYYIINSLEKWGSRWFCSECLNETPTPNSNPMQKQLQRISAQMVSMNAQIKNITDAQDKLEKTSVKIPNAAEAINESKEISKSSWVEIMDEDSGKQKINMITSLAKEVLNNQKQLSVEREDREKNVIIFGATEENKNVENSENDQLFFKTMCEDALEYKESLEVDIKRIPNSKPNQDRPMKVTFKDTWSKRKFLSSLHKLKGNDKYSNIRVSHDMCIADREENAKLLKEAHKKNTEEKPTTFKYKVRGPPWAMKIVKVPQSKN